MQISTLADIAGASTTVPLTTGAAQARQLTLCAIGGTARFGDASVGAAQGVELPEGVPVTFGVNNGDRIDTMQLNQAHAYIPTGTTLTITYEL
jgi:hypothetical protein